MIESTVIEPPVQRAGSDIMQQRSPQPPRAIRHEYEDRGVEEFYRLSGGQYRNPHEPQIHRTLQRAVREWRPDLDRVLDLAAGSGEVTLALRDLGAIHIDGVDPYTYEAYERRVGRSAGRETFEQIAEGALAGRQYTLIVCSFALHLVEPSRLPRLLHQLGAVSPRLLILSPHKRPLIRNDFGWELANQTIVQRVHCRLYRIASDLR